MSHLYLSKKIKIILCPRVREAVMHEVEGIVQSGLLGHSAVSCLLVLNASLFWGAVQHLAAVKKLMYLLQEILICFVALRSCKIALL